MSLKKEKKNKFLAKLWSGAQRTIEKETIRTISKQRKEKSFFFFISFGFGKWPSITPSTHQENSLDGCHVDAVVLLSLGIPGSSEQTFVVLFFCVEINRKRERKRDFLPRGDRPLRSPTPSRRLGVTDREKSPISTPRKSTEACLLTQRLFSFSFQPSVMNTRGSSPYHLYAP